MGQIVLSQFPHLANGACMEEKWKWLAILESERMQLNGIVRTLIQQAESRWEAGLQDVIQSLVATTGGLDAKLERKVLFQCPGAKPYAAVAPPQGTSTVQDFIQAARSDHNLGDSLLHMLSA